MDEPTLNLISTAVAAGILGISTTTLYKWRRENRGPQPYIICGVYRYDREEIFTFLEASRAKPAEASS